MTDRPDKVLVVLAGEIRTPPMSVDARREAGLLLRRLQRGETLSLPQSRPMPAIGSRCHELRINDENRTWRILYRADLDEILVAEVFAKTTRTTPTNVIGTCKKRFREWDAE